MAEVAKTPEEQELYKLLNLEAAFRSSGQEVPDRLRSEISSLAVVNPTESHGSETERDKQKQRMDVQIAAIVSLGISEDIARSHVNFVENGFSKPEDIKRFGSMLDDKEYRDFFTSDTPEAKAQRAKIEENAANHYVEEISTGKMTIQQAEQEYKTAPKTKEGKECACESWDSSVGKQVHEGIRSLGANRSNGYSSTKNPSQEEKISEIAKMLEPVNGLSSQERVADLIVKNEDVEKVVTSTKQVAEKTVDHKYEDKREAAKDIRTEVYTGAEENGVKTDRQEFKKDEADDFAAFFNTEDSKIAVNTLQKVEKDTKTEPSSSPSDVQIAENSKAAEKASPEIGLA